MYILKGFFKKAVRSQCRLAAAVRGRATVMPTAHGPMSRARTRNYGKDDSNDDGDVASDVDRRDLLSRR
jgi:hypothetical protein